MRWHYVFLLLAACKEEDAEQDCGCSGSHAVWHSTGMSGQNIDIDVREVAYAPEPYATVEWRGSGIELYRGLDYVAFIELPDFYDVGRGAIPLAGLDLHAFYCDEGSLVREGPDFYCRVGDELLPSQGELLDGTLELTDPMHYELTVVRDAHDRVDVHLKRVFEQAYPTGEYVYECGVH